MESLDGRSTPSIIRTPATSSAESDNDQLDKPVLEKRAVQHNEPKTHLSNIPKAVSIETSTPSSKDLHVPDGPSACSTPTLISNDTRDKEGSSSTPSRPHELDIEGSIASQLTIASSQTYHSAVTFSEPEIRAPIVGYEIMEQRAKFTVFKIHVQFSEVDSWFIFRRYTDFVRLNDRLREKYPTFRLALPPKRWFGSNFDPNFLEDRQLGLQAFLHNVTGHKDIAQSDAVRDFLCLDDPPGAHDSLEESRALCESLEEHVYNLRKDLAERETQLAQARIELAEARHKISSIMSQAEKAGVQFSIPEFNSSTPSIDSDNSGVDIHSCIEADQVVRPHQHQFRPEQRLQQSSSDTITLSQEKSFFSSPNCNINNSTDYSVHNLADPTTKPSHTKEDNSIIQQPSFIQVT